MRTAILSTIIIVAGALSSFAQGGDETLYLNNYTDSVSYLLGMQIAQNLQIEKVYVNVEILSAGVGDILNRSEAKLSPTERMNVMFGLQAKAAELQQKGDLSPEELAAKLFGKISSNPPTKIKTSNDSISYCIGYNIGEEILSAQSGVNTYILVSAIKSVSANKPLLLTETDILILRMRLESEMPPPPNQYQQTAAESEDFLLQNGARPGVVTLPSGLQYEILKEGTGPKPTINDEVKVHYHGTLINGAVFDSSIERGEPVTFELGKVIKGWIEALQLMPEGSKWKLFIPSKLAYGSRGAGDAIPPNSTLIFEVELISIVK